MSDDFDFSFQRTVAGKDLIRGGEKLERLTWLKKRVAETDLYFLQDGAFSQILFQEVADSFTNGQFIAAIILGYSFIERTIAGRLSHNDEKKLAGEANSKALFEEALERGWLKKEEHESLEQLRPLRNAITHFRDPLHAERPEIRAILSAKTPSTMLEGDARKVLDAAIQVLNKTAI